MAKKLGRDCKLYYSDAVFAAADDAVNQSWNEITNVKDLTTNLEKGEADVSTRASSWRQTLATLKDGSIDFEMMWDTSDAAFTVLQEAWLNDDEVGIAAMDGDIDTAGSEGLASNFNVFSFSRPEPLEEGVTVSIVLKPSSYTEWYTVASS